MNVGGEQRLLELAAGTLSEAGFATRHDELASVRVLIAENPFFIVVIAAADSVDAMVAVDAAVSMDLASAVTHAEVAAKQWDIYLVLLATAHISSDQTDLLYRVAYNTHYLRRLVRTNVPPTPEGVRNALLAFLPLPPPGGQAGQPMKALEDLHEAVLTHGVEPDFATRAFRTFESSGEIVAA